MSSEQSVNVTQLLLKYGGANTGAMDSAAFGESVHSPVISVNLCLSSYISLSGLTMPANSGMYLDR